MKVNRGIAFKVRRALLGVLDGGIFTKKHLRKQLPFLLFLYVLLLLYIANSYHAESVVRHSDLLLKEVKDLRSAQISAKSELMFVSKQSQVALNPVIQARGLKEAIKPPKKIYR